MNQVQLSQIIYTYVAHIHFNGTLHMISIECAFIAASKQAVRNKKCDHSSSVAAF